MKISKIAVEKFRVWFGILKLSYPITKEGIVRSNCSHKNRIEIEKFYVEFVNDLVSTEIRPLVKYKEKVDVTKLYIPSDLIEKINKLFLSVEPMLILYGPVDIKNYPDFDKLEDTDIVIFGDDIITTERRK